MTHWFLVQGAACAGTVVLADGVVAVGAVVVVIVVVALQETLFSCTFVLLVLLGCLPPKSVSAKSAEVMMVSIAFSE